MSKRSIAVIEADVEAACKQHGIRGHLEHDVIEKMIAEYDEEDIQARVFGKFQHLTGLVYKMFDPKVHIIKPFTLDKKDFVVWQSWDTHPRNPDAILWVAIDRQGIHYVVDELYIDSPLNEVVAEIKTKDEKFRIGRRLLEPAGFNIDKRTGYCMAADLSTTYGLVYEPGSKRRLDGVTIVKDKLSYREEHGRMIKPPGLYVFENCTRTIYEFTHWQWDDWRGKAAERKTPRETPQDKDDHAMECLNRVELDNPVFSEYIDPVEMYNYDNNSYDDLDPYAQ